MDFLNKIVSSQGDSKEGEGEGQGGQSTSDLFSSAKVVAEAAQSTYSRNTDSIDKAKVADAAGDLLGAASQYGKLEDKSGGEYVKKAEDYLHQYGSDQPAKDSTPAAPQAQPPPDAEAPATEPAPDAEAPATEPAPDAKAPATDSGSGEAKPEGGVGDYVKMAKGFLNKN